MTQEEMLKTAEIYTGNTAAAKEILGSLSDPQDPAALREACIAWIRLREPSLFQDIPDYTEGAEIPSEIKDLTEICRNLDYEERIAVLMKYAEGLSEEESARLLGLKEQDITALLQSVKRKNPDPVIPEPVEDKPVKTKARTKRRTRTKEDKHGKAPVLSNKFILAAVALAVVIIGSIIGVNSYASGQYRKGLELLEKESWSEAAEALENAIQWKGGGKDAVLKLGDAYFGMEEYEKAAGQYEAYIVKAPNENITDRLRRTYLKAAEQFLAAEDSENAVAWMEKEYTLTHDERTYYRKEAIRSGGVYVDVSGNRFNTDGNPVLLRNDILTLSLSYDAEGRLNKIQGSQNSRKINSTLILKDGKEDHAYTIYFFPEESTSVTYYAEDTASGPLPLSLTVYRPGQKESVTKYTYEKDGDRILSRTVTDSTGIVCRDTYTYDESGKLFSCDTEYEDKTSYRTTYAYDKDGRLTETAVTRNIIELLEKHTYIYKDGRLTEEVLDRKSSYILHAGEPMRLYRRILYKNSASGDPFTASLMDKDGKEKASGYYVQGTGWIWLFSEEFSE